MADIFEIQQLAARYSEAICRRQVAEAVDTYAPDGVLEGPAGEFTGRSAIVAAIEGAMAELDLVFQTTQLGIVRVEGDRAFARFPITEWTRRREDGAGAQFLAFYDDQLTKTSGNWLFARRTLRPVTLGRHRNFPGNVFLPPRFAQLKGAQPD